MDDFDFLNQPADPSNTQSPEDDLFAADNSNQENQNAMNNSTPRSSAFDDESTNDFLAPSSTSGLEDATALEQSNTYAFDTTPPPTSDEVLQSNSSSQQYENISFETASQSGPLSRNTESTSKPSESLSPLQAFNQRRQEEIAVKDAEENRQKDELRQQAKRDLERWYQDRKMTMERKRETMKEEEDTLRTNALEKSDKESCDWAKVIRFLEFSPGSQVSKSKRDITRMKSCIIHAKRDKDTKKSGNSA